MRKPEGKDGVPYRQHLEFAARKGSEFAIEELIEPDAPAYIEYVWEYFMQLDRGRREAAMGGMARLTWGDIGEWSRLMDVRLAPYEVEGLILLDSALRHPEAFE